MLLLTLNKHNFYKRLLMSWSLQFATEFCTLTMKKIRVAIYSFIYSFESLACEHSCRFRLKSASQALTRLELNFPSVPAKNSSNQPGRPASCSYSNACRTISNRSKSFVILASRLTWALYSCSKKRVHKTNSYSDVGKSRKKSMKNCLGKHSL